MPIQFTPVTREDDLPVWDDGTVASSAMQDASVTDVPGEPWARTDLVTVRGQAQQQVLAHLRSCDVEQGGLLIGVPFRQRTGKAIERIVIVDSVAAAESRGTAISLSMGNEVWQAAHARIAALRDLATQAAQANMANPPRQASQTAATDDAGRLVAALRIVGWYHSHPGLGAFFSSTDRATQAAFFRQPWSVGWVIDPDDGQEAWFAGPDSRAIGRYQPPAELAATTTSPEPASRTHMRH